MISSRVALECEGLRYPLEGRAARLAALLVTHQARINGCAEGSLEFHFSGRKVVPKLHESLGVYEEPPAA